MTATVTTTEPSILEHLKERDEKAAQAHLEAQRAYRELVEKAARDGQLSRPDQDRLGKLLPILSRTTSNCESDIALTRRALDLHKTLSVLAEVQAETRSALKAFNDFFCGPNSEVIRGFEKLFIEGELRLRRAVRAGDAEAKLLKTARELEELADSRPDLFPRYDPPVHSIGPSWHGGLGSTAGGWRMRFQEVLCGSGLRALAQLDQAVDAAEKAAKAQTE
ncbi:MAG: hypothetical protein IT443_07410 [Phycisphaeraceae bacterium]|nr:hypothetical protein [Phycisphaeraceae bacterium]